MEKLTLQPGETLENSARYKDLRFRAGYYTLVLSSYELNPTEKELWLQRLSEYQGELEAYEKAS